MQSYQCDRCGKFVSGWCKWHLAGSVANDIYFDLHKQSIANSYQRLDGLELCDECAESLKRWWIPNVAEKPSKPSGS